MWSDPARQRSRRLLLLAIMAVLLATLWALRTPPDANSDRYDYLGRAYHVLQGEGPRPLVVYPLRFAFEGAHELPAENLTRPPLWPHLVAIALRLGAGEGAGVIVAAFGLLTLLPMMMLAGDRVFGAGAGGFAALAGAVSFATVRALWGGGPEIWIALLLYAAWTWNATGRYGGLGIGAILGVLPWLHPIGWLYAGIGWVSRVGRSAPRALFIAALLVLTIGTPWYFVVGTVTGSAASPLQSQAELARAVLDPGGLGPYRGLDPLPSGSVVLEEPARLVHQWASNLKAQTLHLDAWLAWPLVVLALIGIARDRSLALRDAGLGLVAFMVVALVAREPRLLVPLLPIACTWAGAGFVSAAERFPRWFAVGAAAVLVVVPWLLPLGAAVRPAGEFAGQPIEWRDPSRASVLAVGSAGEPVFIDSAVLAWRARSLGVLIPDTPATLERLRHLPALAGATHLVLGRGRESPWLHSASEQWMHWLAAREAPERDGLLIVPLHAETTDSSSTAYVPEPLELDATDRPDDLVAVPLPPASRAGLLLRRDAAVALDRLVGAAREDGIELRIVSAYRSFERQQQLHASAIRRHGPDQRWVAAPGRSEHQLGTTVDFADAALAHVLVPGFAQTAESDWLAREAQRFGWVRSYTEENETVTGYRPEPWHFRYRPELFELEDGAPADSAAEHRESP